MFWNGVLGCYRKDDTLQGSQGRFKVQTKEADLRFMALKDE